MQNDPNPEEETVKSGAGESSHVAASATSSQSDAGLNTASSQTPEGQSIGAGESSEAGSDAVASPS